MRVICVIILGILNLTCSGQSHDSLIKGNSALLNKKYDESIKYFNKVLRADPTNERALILRSQANYSLKKYQLVVEDCEKILLINSQVTSEEDQTAIWNLGVVYNNLRQFDKARIYLTEALKFKPEKIKIYEAIGYSFLEENNFDQAILQFEEMLKIDSHSALAHYGVGKSYYLKGDFTNSISAFDRAIEINPAYGIAYQNRGSAKLELDDIEGCCQDWRKCLELGIVEIEPYLKEVCL